MWCSRRLELTHQFRLNLSLAARRRLPHRTLFEPSSQSARLLQQKHARRLHTTPFALASSPPVTRDRGPPSQESTQTDFGKMNILAAVPSPASSIDACLPDGFQFDNGLTVSNSGVILVGGEVFTWAPWKIERKGDVARSLVNLHRQLELQKDTLGILELVWPKPGQS